MHENGKMRPVETISGTGDGGIKENNGEGMNSTMIYYKNFCKCHHVPWYNNNNNNKNRLSNNATYCQAIVCLDI
jgi:hypothetical protein